MMSGDDEEGASFEGLVRFRIKDWYEDGLPDMPSGVDDAITRLLAAATIGDTWAAVWWALHVGAEWTSAVPHPDADRGRATREHARRGGRETAQDTRDKAFRTGADGATLRLEVAALRASNLQLSMTAACDLVGHNHKISGRTVKRRIGR